MLELLRPEVLIPWLLGMVFGVFVGSTPGLTATMAVALIVPISFHMDDPNAGLAMIIGVSFTAIFSGDIPATFLRIPGTPASAAAVLDGHEMAKQGKGGLALRIDLICSCLGGLFGVLMLAVVAPQLANFALKFSNFEDFWLAMLGLSLSVLVCQGGRLKGALAACLGVLLATVGSEVIANAPRYTFDQDFMKSGIRFIPAMIGLFGLSEVLRNVQNQREMDAPSIQTGGESSWAQSLILIWRHKWTALRSAVVGTVVGALPGAGADVAAWGAYGIAQKTSKNPEKFGNGAIEGVIAPTSANNAAVAGAWIPALVFGVPGDAVTAIVLGALVMYGIQTGPEAFTQKGGAVTSILFIAAMTQVFLLPAGFMGIKTFQWIMRLPRRVILTSVLLFSVVGAYALNNSLLDLYVMFFFGLLGLYLEKQRVPLPPLILGMILGEILEEKLRSGLISAEGNYLEMFTRPISGSLVILLVSFFLVPLIAKRFRALKRN